MKKQKQKKAYSLLLDGRLPIEQAQGLLHELQDNPQNQAECEKLQDVRRLLRESYAESEVPVGFESRLRYKLKKEAYRKQALKRALYEIRSSLSLRGGLSSSLLGFSFGILVMVALGFGLSFWEGPSNKTSKTSPPNNQEARFDTGIQNHQATSHTTLIQANQRREIPIQWTDIEPLFEKQVHAYHTISNRLQSHSKVDPEWLSRQLQHSGLPERNQRLQSFLPNFPQQQDTQEFVYTLDGLCKKLLVITSEAQAKQEPLESQEILQIFKNVKVPRRYILRLHQNELENGYVLKLRELSGEEANGNWPLDASSSQNEELLPGIFLRIQKDLNKPRTGPVLPSSQEDPAEEK